jgi:hypothetical protein
MCQQKAQESSSINFLHQAENSIQECVVGIAAFSLEVLATLSLPNKFFLNAIDMVTEASNSCI